MLSMITKALQRTICVFMSERVEEHRGFWARTAHLGQCHHLRFHRKIFEEDNIAVAVVVGLFMLGVAIVIHGAFSS